MAEDKLEIVIKAKTDEFVKSLEDIKKRSSDISKQMQEIDKQLKSESVDRVAKLSEKLDLVKRSAALATKEAEEYAKSIKEITDNQKEGEELSEKQKKKIEDLSEKMALAKQKANTFAVEIDKLSSELNEAASSADNAEDEIDETGDAMQETGNQAADAANGGLKQFMTIMGANIAGSLITKGIEKVIGLFKNLAAAAWNAAKNIASAMKDYAQEAIDMAADYHDALGYSEQVFEDNSESVQKWVDENTNALRINKSELLQNVNSFGALYRSFGIGSEKAAEMSESLVQLAVDLRSATGKDTQEIIQSLTSVLTGGYQAGYKYGIVINESMVKAKAATMGYSEELTQAQKEQVIFNLIMEQTAVSQGQAARESGNYKSQLDAMKVTFDNLKISIGEKLLPVVTDLITKANEFLQSEEGQKMLDDIVKKIGEISEKVKEFIESGQLEEWVQKFKENLPGILEDLKDLAKIVGDLVQPILDVYRAIQGYNDLKAMDEAIKSSKKEVHAFADSVDVDMNTLRIAIKGFADLNNISLTEIYGNWSTYQPQIAEYMAATGTISEDMKNTVNTATSQMASQTKTDLDATASAFQDGLTRAGNADTSGLRAKTEEVETLGSRIKTALANFIDNSGWFQNAPGAEYAHRAAGGPALPGHIYQVNDDHGIRKEMFIPSVQGYILDGNQTQSIINNSTDNHSVGDVNVYVTSYGTNAAAIADEIGQEVNKRLRMSGAW